jgi:hypothetical protein
MHLSTPRRRPALLVAACVSAAVLTLSTGAATAQASCHHPHGTRVLVSGLGGTLGSTIGPDGALYVPDGVAGTVTRVDPWTGHTRLFTSGLPTRIAPVGGAMDIAFLGRTAYVLVSLVGPDVGGTSVEGIYRVDGPHSSTAVADIGAFAIAHPPATDYFIPGGVEFAMLPYHHGFLVTDGHHNRVYRVTTSGDVSEVETFGDIVPTGIASWRGHVYMTEAGPVPHLAENGRVVRLDVRAHTSTEIARGAPLAIDTGTDGHHVYALSQGTFPADGEPGSPAIHHTGALMRVRPDGSMRTVADGLDQPTSMQFIGHTAYVVTLNGEIDAIPLHR